MRTLTLLAALLGYAAHGASLVSDVQFRRDRQVARATLFVPSAGRPKVDGRLDDPCWRQAASIANFRIAPTRSATNKTTVLLACDKQTLFLGFRCTVQPGATLRHNVPPTVRDGRVWGDDCLDVFLSHDEGRTIRQFIINALGAVYDAKKGDTTWNPAYEHAARKAAAGFTAELAIPRSVLGVPAAGTPALLFGVGRNDRTLGELAASALPYGDPVGFARIVLGSKADYEAGRAARLTKEAVGIELFCDREEYPSTQAHAWCRLRVRAPAHGSLASVLNAELCVTDPRGKPLATEPLPPLQAEVIDFALDLTRLPEAEARLTARLRAADGKVLAEASRSLRRLASQPPREGRITLRIPAVARSPRRWPITVGVPFPNGAIADAATLALTDDQGRPVPLQASVAARWSKGGSAKWILCHFPALVGPRDATYTLSFGKRGQPPDGEPPLTIAETPDAYVVTTGPLRFRVRRRGFNGLDQAWLDADRNSEFAAGEAMLVEQPGRGCYLVDHTGKRYVGERDTQAVVVVEERGPQQIVLRAEGWQVAEDGSRLGRFVVRLVARAGVPFVRIFHTFILTADSTKVRYRDIALSLSPRLTFACFGSELGHVVRMRRTENSAWLLQRDDLHYDFWHNGKFAASGSRSDGRVSVGDTSRGLSLMVKDLWQQYPKELEVRQNALTVHLWPAHGGPRRHVGDRLTIRNAGHLWFAHEGAELDLRVPAEYFDPKKGFLPELTVENAKPGVPNPSVVNAIGLAKTHEMLLHFHGASWERAGAAEVNRVFQAAPAAVVDPQWVCATGVFGGLAPRDPARFPAAEHTIDVITAKALRHQTLDRDYGMFNYGDSHHNWHWQERRWSLHRIWRNTHHGWGRWPWLLYARSGDTRLLGWAIANARHVEDVDHCHHTTPEFDGLPWPRGKLVGGICDYKGLAHWSAGGRLGYNSAADPFLWHCYVTGERRGRTVALEHGRALLAHPKPRPHREGSGRVTSAVALYQDTWDNDYLEFIERHIDCLLGTQAADGSFPQWENFAPFLQRYVEQTGSRRARQAMVRWADFDAARPLGAGGHHANLNVLAHAALYAGDRKHLAPALHRLQMVTDHLYEGPDPRVHGTSIPYRSNCADSYFLQEAPYLLHAFATLGRPKTPAAPRFAALRTFNRTKLDGKDWHVLVVHLRETADAPRKLTVAGRGRAKCSFRGVVRDLKGRVLADATVGLDPKSGGFAIPLALSKDDVLDYVLSVTSERDFTTLVPITADDAAVREVYSLQERGLALSNGSRFYFEPPDGATSLRLYAEGRPWPNELCLWNGAGELVDKEQWIRASEPYWAPRFVEAHLAPADKAGPWSFALFVGHGSSITRFEASPKAARQSLFFAARPEKLFTPR